MKVIQAVGWYFPESSGGTEVYVSQLASELRQYGVICSIAAPHNGTSPYFYSHDDTEVYRYPVNTVWDLKQIRGLYPHDGFDEFRRWLSEQDAEIYHQHSLTSGCSLHHLEAAREAGKKTLMTIHVPSPICLKGTLIRIGAEACDGVIDTVKCGVCSGAARGMPMWAANLMARAPLPFSRFAERRLPQSRLTTALARPALVEAHRRNLTRLASMSDRVIAVCQWLYDTLAANGVPKEKLVLSRQGAFDSGAVTADSNGYSQNNVEGAALRVGYLGRWDKVKGIHVLVEAVRKLPRSVKIELLIYAQAQNKEGEIYRDEVSRIAADDERIHISDALGRDAVPSALSSFDILAVPSQWLETGPLVILEAFAVGVPVLGSNLGGIAELVQHGENGLLVDYSDTQAWSDSISALASNRQLLNKLREGIKPPRNAKTVADEMASIYRSVLEQ